MMSKTEINELIEVIYDLNYSQEDSSNGLRIDPFTLVTDGMTHRVQYLELSLWDSDTDERDYVDEENDIRIPIREHIVKEADLIRSSLAEHVYTTNQEESR